MNKKTVKIISIISIIICILISCTASFALKDTDVSVRDITKKRLNQEAVEKTGVTGWRIITILRNAGIVIAFIILMVLGIRYIMGSVEQKAEYKRTMLPYVIGAVALFAASGIATIVVNIASQFHAS